LYAPVCHFNDDARGFFRVRQAIYI